MLDKALNFFTAKMQCAKNDQEDFIQVVMWARRVKAKDWANAFGQCGPTQPSD